MNKLNLFTVIILGVVFACSSPAEEAKQDAETWLTDWNGYDPKELSALAEKPSRDSGDNRRMMELILQAAAKSDKSFESLLKRKELREANNVDLALLAYEYNLNKSETALNRILAQLATEDIGADVDTTLALAFIDEWDLSIRAFRKHFVRTDGAGGLNHAFFCSTRAFLYPKKYEKMRKAIEAPIEWQAPLLPRKD
jgi:hypothetical protein